MQSQDSADAAVKTILAETGQLDIVIHNASRFTIGYVEAFTADDFADLLDINVVGGLRSTARPSLSTTRRASRYLPSRH